VLLTTRGGTNDFHGGVYEYFRNDVLDANDWFANQAGKPKDRNVTMISEAIWVVRSSRTRLSSSFPTRESAEATKHDDC